MATYDLNLFEEVENLIHDEIDYTTTDLMNRLQSLINCKILTTENITNDLVDLEFLEEIKHLVTNENIPVFFGRTMRDIKFLLTDDSLREHEVIMKYMNLKKVVITSVKLPYSPIQDCEYSSLQQIIQAYRAHVESLCTYFNELERIDRFCTVMEPLEPTFKDDFRRILLDERTWLHVEVSPDGSAKNMHLVGQSELWSNKLQSGLLSWDHDKDIVENIMTVFDLVNFPTSVTSRKSSTTSIEMPPEQSTLCSICLCAVLPDSPGVPLPLCQNAVCGVYFHRNCLFQVPRKKYSKHGLIKKADRVPVNNKLCRSESARSLYVQAGTHTFTQ
ncbi:unnamed protein product [Chilo suppressalis]|uniref:FANCL UBC-like domain-containing protein n=1 Tax=Chilo suppressalis TaxID=168631 RepID=A0ABN8L1I3_CHISP|nr:unnamed protein product [Chilo suppressalis]